ncbi:MAG: hypothetical protein K8T10_01585 [Candidatus Eremiobacteraeota bacterium]|nr:hypothetical protein [Candidatus Eremiobacteraeota bacterium]
MAIIKGSRYRKPEDDNDNSGQTGTENREAPIKRGGLIKGKKHAPSTSKSGELSSRFLSDKPLPSKYRGGDKKSKRGGKILKAAWTSILKSEEEEKPREEKKPYEDEIFGDASDFPEAPPTKPLEEEFQPTTFEPKGTEEGIREVVMIPTKPGKPKKEEELPEDADFQVEESEPQPSVDTLAIIAEAEHKGREKAQKIIEHAQVEAKKLIDQAKIYGETAKTEAHREGFKLGKEDGNKVGLEEFKEYMGQAKNLMTQIIRERETILNSIEPELAKLSMSIAEKIIAEELVVNKEAVISIIKSAIVKVKAREEVMIKVSPDDLEYVRENKEIFARLIEGLKELEITSDPRVEQGGCLIETKLGNADARISTQLATIELAFKNLETGGV